MFRKALFIQADSTAPKYNSVKILPDAAKVLMAPLGPRII